MKFKAILEHLIRIEKQLEELTEEELGRIATEMLKGDRIPYMTFEVLISGSRGFTSVKLYPFVSSNFLMFRYSV
ncbi:hypothetical protein DRO97_07535 [Archaeoglobales archaeon]|nr:MAG: hypothetical protein DRO97_07535 [Archaeoglobales archaeon]